MIEPVFAGLLRVFQAEFRSPQLGQIRTAYESQSDHATHQSEPNLTLASRRDLAWQKFRSTKTLGASENPLHCPVRRTHRADAFIVRENRNCASDP